MTGQLFNTLGTYTHDRAVRECATIEAARGPESRPRVIQLFGAVGGRTSNPDHFYGYGVAYRWPERPELGTCIEFWPGDAIRECTRSVYLIDSRPYYVAGWQGDGGTERVTDGHVLLHPYAPSQQFTPRRCVFLTMTDVPAHSQKGL